MLRIFVGWDSRFEEPAKVLAHSIRSRASVPVVIRFLDYAHLNRCYDFDRVPDPLASTEFTYTRFLVPYLCDYAGTALFLDNDMACLADIEELWMHYHPGSQYAVRVVKHEHKPVDGSRKMYGAVQTAYPRKNWSSLMFMNCSKLRCWTKEVVETAPGSRLHRFEDIPDDQIGEIPHRWNDLDQCLVDTKIVHWTSGGPWYPEYADCPAAGVWYKARDEYRASLGAAP